MNNRRTNDEKIFKEDCARARQLEEEVWRNLIDQGIAAYIPTWETADRLRSINPVLSKSSPDIVFFGHFIEVRSACIKFETIVKFPKPTVRVENVVDYANKVTKPTWYVQRFGEGVIMCLDSCTKPAWVERHYTDPRKGDGVSYDAHYTYWCGFGTFCARLKLLQDNWVAQGFRSDFWMDGLRHFMFDWVGPMEAS